MKRSVENDLIEWKNQKEKYPLLVRGARQVGKSYTIEQFGKESFEYAITLNFELEPNLKACFLTLDPQEIINRIQVIKNSSINANTLLFFDEIQECPQAIKALRYFKEKMPHIPVIGAGSLLEFTFRQEEFSMPVGRIQFLHMAPFSFREFLLAIGSKQLLTYLDNLHVGSIIDEVIHKDLLEKLNTYYIVGGMPAILKAYVENHDMHLVSQLQASLLEAYRNDFGKYASHTHHKYLQRVFNAIPRMVGERIKYSNIDQESKSRDLKNAIELLSLAEIVNPIYATKASGLPLATAMGAKRFKLLFLDVGLMQYMCGLQKELQFNTDIFLINRGSVAEQFVGQELHAYSWAYEKRALYYWAREEKNSSAEVDYVHPLNSDIIPIEVKAGVAGRLQSLKIFMEEKQTKIGVRFWSNKITFEKKILSLPLYLVHRFPDLIREIQE